MKRDSLTLTNGDYGAADTAGFYNAGGWDPVIIANFSLLLWFLAAGMLLIRKSQSVASVAHRG